ncbi:TraB family-domain-containing protein [Tribonema minus]|uniref:TraB family-domain-containing protein n=1 Tax=Tribonema minus TaxID=303371 RepID=A0A836CI89_9STRA|nr:TraB family-domain-containing protein [Tribonema minus]
MKQPLLLLLLSCPATQAFSASVVKPQHSEQRQGYLPPKPVLDDGHVVDTAALDDLQSASDVARVIREVQPQSVVVELCRSRVGLMMEEEPGAANAPASPLGLSGGNLQEALQRSVQVGGQGMVLLRAALAHATASATETVRPGLDFRAANACATALDAEIVLGDRPIEITLKRAWAALSTAEKVRLAAGLAFAAVGGGKAVSGEGSELLAAARGGRVDDDVVDALMAKLSRQFPALVAPLVHERDAYLAWSLKRSRAVCGKSRVVGVVGRAHLPGVLKAIQGDNGGDTLIFKELIGKR